MPPGEDIPLGGGASAAPRSEAELLATLRDRIQKTQEAAERIAAEATAAAREKLGEADDVAGESARRPPPSGYTVPGAGTGDGDASDLQALVALIELARGLAPPELVAQLAELFREMLLLVRALIDWYLERAERRRAEPVEVEDIPIY